MLSTQSLREQLDRYADGAISLEAFEEWLAAESWDMRRWVPLGVQRFVESIQATFIQHSDGLLGADQLREYLLQRRAQLHRAADVTKEMEARRSMLKDFVKEALRSQSQAFPLILPETLRA